MKRQQDKSQCSIDGCKDKIYYTTRKICQKHYFRFMRNGTYNLTRPERKYRIENPAGYQKLYEPLHELSNTDGYVYEHRFVYYKHDKDVNECSLCNCEINWKTLHIDHIDENVKNNDILNLRATCRNCNTTRGRKAESMAKLFLECRGVRMSVADWARREDVKVAYNTIKYRLKKGYTAEDAIFSERLTHQNTKTIKTKLNFME